MFVENFDNYNHNNYNNLLVKKDKSLRFRKYIHSIHSFKKAAAIIAKIN